MLVIFLVAILSIAMLEIQRRSNLDLAQQKIESLKIVRDKIYDRVSTLARTEEALFRSARSEEHQIRNAALIACLNNNSSCPAIGSSRMQGFVLINPSGGQAIAGSSTLPVRYDLKGEICQENCNFEVRSFFWAECPNGASQCTERNNIQTIVQVKTYQTEENTVRLADRPTDEEVALKRQLFAQSTRVTDINNFRQNCPPGSRLVEFDKSNRIKCECLGGPSAQVGLDANGLPICKGKLCADPNMTFLGLDEDWKPICAGREQEFHCFQRAFRMNNNSVNCGSDQFGQPIRIKGLYNTSSGCKVKKNDKIECEQMTAVCCVRVPEPQ